MKYLVVVEETGTGYSAYSPDLPGCVAAGASRDEVEREMVDAIAFHIDGLRAEGLEVPVPRSTSLYVDVPSATTAGT
jgi:predicted RNase H-like HicB family nuclease